MLLRNLIEKTKFNLNQWSIHETTDKYLDCKRVRKEILKITKKHLETLKINPKVNVILSLDSNGKPKFESELYIRNKIKCLKEINIELNVIKQHFTSSEQLRSLIETLNKDKKTNGTFVQLPLIGDSIKKLQVRQILNHIKLEKDVDALSSKTMSKLNDPEWFAIKPTTCLGICALLSYYDITTQGKHVVILGKSDLVGKPMMTMLMNYPFNATVTNCDIFTENIKSICQNADILIAACGSANFIKKDFVKPGVIIIDVGINRILTSNNDYKVTGDVDPTVYELSKLYTAVPNGVGLLTLGSLGMNIMNACRLQKGLDAIDLIQEIYRAHYFNPLFKSSSLERNEIEGKERKKLSIMLLSSSYNALSQNIEQLLIGLGHNVKFCLAQSEDSIRNDVNQFNPNLVICPTLMKVIPKDVWTKYKCLIIHPGIVGDRGPSSLDWAILNEQKEWGVTVLEASEELDAGNIWATKTFSIPVNSTKTSIYNGIIMKLAEKLVIECLSKYNDSNFIPKSIDKWDAPVKGTLHRPIKQTDTERIINWDSDNTGEILRKVKAADSQPGVKAKLQINSNLLTRFVYGICGEYNLKADNHIKPGEIFAKRNEAICVATLDGAVWLSQLRSPKTNEEKYPYKLPATLHLNNFNHSIREYEIDPLAKPDSNTFQEMSFEDYNEIGILNFNFYNGAMSTSQCNRFVKALEQCLMNKNLKVLILAGNETNWSNGIHLNVIENSSKPNEEAWNNIISINNIVKNILFADHLIVISAIRANAGAGGAYLALAADFVFAQDGIILNPHYKKMGLFGSELHTYTASKRIGKMKLEHLKETAEPINVKKAIEIKFIDDLDTCLKARGIFQEKFSFMEKVKLFSLSLLDKDNELSSLILKKQEILHNSGNYNSILKCEEYELSEMHKDFFNDRNGFEKKRKAFVRKLNF